MERTAWLMSVPCPQHVRWPVSGTHGPFYPLIFLGGQKVEVEGHAVPAAWNVSGESLSRPSHSLAL